MKKEVKNLVVLGILTAIICLAMFLPNMLSGLPVSYGTDLKPEQVFFNIEFTNLMNNFFKNGTLPFYSWSMFLGTNYLASQTFYNFGDVFTWLSLLVQQMNFFDKTLLFEIMKFFVSSYSMYFLLKEMNIQVKIRFIGALCYAFSGWAIFFSGQLMFHSFYCFVPLYFLAVERYLKYDKKTMFLVITVLLLISNWYYFYTVSLFLTMYFTYRYYLINKGFKGYFFSCLKLIGVYFIGVMISAIILIPTILYIANNDRVGFQNLTFFEDMQIYMHLISSMFSPNYLYLYRSNIFETNWHVTREICIYAGVIVSLMTCQIFAYQNKLFKKATILFYSVLIIIAFLPSGDAMMHGFSEPSFRWLFLIVFLNILTACHILNDFESIDMKKFKNIAIVVSCFVFVIIPLAVVLNGKIDELLSVYLPQWILFGSCAVLIGLMAFTLIKSKHSILIILVVTTLEFSVFGSLLYTIYLDKSGRGTYEFFDQVTHVLQENDNELNDYLNYLDQDNYSSYYRVYVPRETIYWGYSHNMSVAYQLNGLMVYFSTYSPSINKLKEIAPQITEFSSAMILNIRDGDLMNFLNVKYAIVLNENELPEKVEWKLIQDDYRGNLKIYENMNYRAIGTTYTDAITYSDYSTGGNNLADLLYLVVSEEKDIDEIKGFLKSKVSTNLVNVNFGGNQLTGSAYLDENSFMVITLPYDEGWKVLVNGNEVKKYEVNGGFIGIPVNKGENVIEMFFVPQGFKVGAIISGIGIILGSLLFLYEFKRNRKKRNEKL